MSTSKSGIGYWWNIGQAREPPKAEDLVSDVRENEVMEDAIIATKARFLNDLLLDIPDGKIIGIRICMNGMDVMTQVAGQQHCGSSSILESPHERDDEP